jgi:hypothetical protein
MFKMEVSNLNTVKSSFNLWSRNSEQMLNISSTWNTACMDKSCHGMSHPFRIVEVAANSWTVTKMVWWIKSYSSIGTLYTITFKFPVIKSFKYWYRLNLRTMQIFPLYLSVYHDRSLLDTSHTCWIKCAGSPSCKIHAVAAKRLSSISFLTPFKNKSL